MRQEVSQYDVALEDEVSHNQLFRDREKLLSLLTIR